MKLHLYFLILFLLIVAFEGLSQTSISGIVIDSNSNQPVENVYVINQNNTKYSCLTNEDGFFSIKGDSLDTLNFYRIGSEYVTAVCEDGISLNVKMIPKDYVLKEVVITNEDASKIYQKSLSNLIANYLPGTAIYVWHGVQEEDAGRKIESYARYLASTNRKIESGKMSFDLRLLDLNHIENTSNSKPINLPFFLLGLPLRKQDKVIKVDSEDDSLILLQYTFVHKKETRLIDIIINKSDTVLLCQRYSYFEPEKDVKKMGILLGTVLDTKEYLNLNITKENDYYYIEQIDVNISFYLKWKKSNKKEYRKIENSIIFIHKVDENINTKKLKKLDGGTKQLFNLKPTTIERFWEN